MSLEQVLLRIAVAAVVIAAATAAAASRTSRSFASSPASSMSRAMSFTVDCFASSEPTYGRMKPSRPAVVSGRMSRRGPHLDVHPLVGRLGDLGRRPDPGLTTGTSEFLKADDVGTLQVGK